MSRRPPQWQPVTAAPLADTLRAMAEEYGTLAYYLQKITSTLEARLKYRGRHATVCSADDTLIKVTPRGAAEFVVRFEFVNREYTVEWLVNNNQTVARRSYFW